jgi:group I intron endonuclease
VADLRKQTDMTKPTCEFCDKPVAVISKGWCSKHYSAWYRHGDPLYGEHLLPPGTMGVYSITCVANGWVYIGSSMSVRGRWTTHKSWLRNGTHKTPQLQADWNTYGEDSFLFEMVSIIEDKTKLRDCEQEHITAAIATGKCYNLSPSSRNNGGHRFTPEQSRRLSDAMTGKSKSAEHRANLWINREVTPGFREQMAANGRSGKGKLKTAKHRRNIGLGQQGSANHAAKVTEEQVLEIWLRRAAGELLADLSEEFGLSQATISQIASGKRWAHVTAGLREAQAISHGNKGKPKSEAHRAKLSEAQRAFWGQQELTPELSERMADLARRGAGQPKSEEHKRKISEAQKGKTLSPEHLANLRAAKAKGGKPLKLTADQVREIKRRLPTESVAALAREYGVKPASVSDIKAGRSWRHIT